MAPSSSSNEQPPPEKSPSCFDVINDINGVPERVVLRQIDGSSAEIYLCGGQVTSWKNSNKEELLFVSRNESNKPALCDCLPDLLSILNLGEPRRKEKDVLPSEGPVQGGRQAQIESPEAIYGGIHICFRQQPSSNLRTLQAHGSRIMFWKIDTKNPSNTGTSINFILHPPEEDMKDWPYRFEIHLNVTLGSKGELMLTSLVRNADTKPFTFAFAYYSYLSFSDISFMESWEKDGHCRVWRETLQTSVVCGLCCYGEHHAGAY